MTKAEKDRLAGSRILVVEDSRTQAEYLCHLLEQEGYTVVTAANGREALEVIHRALPALVLSDIIMPEMDGYELCRAIKADKTISGIPVVLVTQLFNPADVLKGLESGADNFIVKPFEPGQVYSCITTTLETAGISDPEGPQPGIEVVFEHEPHRITSGRSRILNILLSTYEFAVRKNTELQETHEQVSALNEELMTAVDGLQIANRDLSKENAERRRVEKALADANRKLNLLTSITRHDISNQILALNAYIHLSETEITDPAVLTNLQKAKTAAQMIERQIAFTKQYEDIGSQAPAWQDTGEIVNLLRSTCRMAGIELLTRDLEIGVYADPLLSKVFENLVDNSIRHGQRVQHITISAVRQAVGDMIIRYQDDGEGVPEADKEKIFRKAFGKNTGLGLFLSREILGITGITIRETGVPGRGAVFEITIPRENVRNAGEL